MGAAYASGRILVALQVHDGPQAPGRIEGRFYDVAAHRLDPPFPLTDTEAFDPQVVAVQGRFFVTWRQGPLLPRVQVLGRMVKTDGGLGKVESLTGDESARVFTIGQDGRVVLVWSMLTEDGRCILKSAALTPASRREPEVTLKDSTDCFASPSRRGRYVATKEGVGVEVVDLYARPGPRRTVVTEDYAFASAVIETTTGALVVWEGSSPGGENSGLRTRVVSNTGALLGEEHVFPTFHAGFIPALVSDGARTYLLTGPHSTLLELDQHGSPRGSTFDLTPCSPKTGLWVETDLGPYLLWVEPRHDGGACAKDRAYVPGHDEALLAPIRCASSASPP